MKHLFKLLVVSIVAALAGWYFGVSAAILWGIFMAFALYGWDTRIVGSIALFFLASCPVVLSLKNEDQAETMAVYAFFFLVMTVTLQIIELKCHPERFPDETDHVKK